MNYISLQIGFSQLRADYLDYFGLFRIIFQGILHESIFQLWISTKSLLIKDLKGYNVVDCSVLLFSPWYGSVHDLYPFPTIYFQLPVL